MTHLRDSALAYAALEQLNVLPLQEQGKIPLVAHGLDDATTDAAQITQWWTTWPNANIGIRTGDIVVVDEDDPGALAALAFENGQKLPSTRIARTGKGMHYYFRQPPNTRIRNTAGRLAAGIDTRGDGGYVVAPPSIHPDGGAYEWVDHSPIAPFPAWLIVLLELPAAKPVTPFLGRSTPYAQRALEQEHHTVAVAAEGSRNHTLNVAAFSLAQLVAGGELDEQDMRASLGAAARACGLPDKEAHATIDSGIRAGLLEPRRSPESNGNGLRAHTAPRPTDAPADPSPLPPVDPGKVDSWVPQDLNDLPETPPDPPNLGNTHIVYPGKRHVFSGPPESAKTLAAYCILIQVVRNGGTAILIDFEMGAYDARQRLRELGATPLEISHIAYIEPDEPANPKRIAMLASLQPSVVVIDASAGVYSLEGLDDNKRLDVERVSNTYIRSFWRAGIATILIDHVVKDNEARGRYAIGSERKLGGADVHLGFQVIREVSRGTNGKYTITTHKDRGGYLKRGHLADLVLESDPETHAIKWSFTEAVISKDSKGQFRRTKIMENVSIKLELADKPLTVNEVKKLVKGNSEYAGEAIATLIDEGYVTLEDGPNRSKLLTSIRGYRQAEDPQLKVENESGDSVVPVWFSSDSGIVHASGGSVVPGALAPEPPEPSAAAPQNTPEPVGWFSDDGTLDDAGHAAYLASIEPDQDELDQ